MLRLLVDTSVWLDLAVRRDGQAWIVPLRGLIAQDKLELLVPSLVKDEFERNRPRLEAAVTKGVVDKLNQLRKELREFAGDQHESIWLEEIRQRIPLVNSMAPQNFRDIAELLRGGRAITPTNAEYANVVQRGLDKTAPFHSPRGSKSQSTADKNCVADALLIEMYRSHARQADPSDQYCFVTSNHRDFSISNGDYRRPHPDLAEFFSGTQSRYIYGIEGLDALLAECFSSELMEFNRKEKAISLRGNWEGEEPRTLVEILDAEAEYFDMVCYVRSKVGPWRGMADDPMIPYEYSKEMRELRARVEAKHDRKELHRLIGPGRRKAWMYGYINGKLAALRWVLGSERDDLATPYLLDPDQNEIRDY